MEPIYCQIEFTFRVVPAETNVESMSRELARDLINQNLRGYNNYEEINMDWLEEKVTNVYIDIFEQIKVEFYDDIRIMGLFDTIAYDSAVPNKLGFTFYDCTNQYMKFESLGEPGWVDSVVSMATEDVLDRYLKKEEYMRHIDLDRIDFGEMQARLDYNDICRAVDIEFETYTYQI